jgi:hypothetical protein
MQNVTDVPGGGYTRRRSSESCELKCFLILPALCTGIRVRQGGGILPKSRIDPEYGRQTDRQKNRQTDKQTDRQTNRSFH